MPVEMDYDEIYNQYSGHPGNAIRYLIDRIRELEKNQVTHEFDEETGYCLCPCCRHGI